MAKKGLGKGLNAFFTAEIQDEFEDKQNIKELRLSEIEPNKKQPRQNFDEEKIDALAQSIAEHGLIQPIIVTDKGNGFYGIVAGERRWRAAKKAGLKTVPVIIKEYSTEEAAQIALIENLQREDLNPIEEAMGYKSLLDEFNMTQESISKKIGKSRSAIANSLRLLSLNEDIMALVISGEISEGHARAVLSLPTKELRDALVSKIISDSLNVRQAEALAKQLIKKTPIKAPAEKSDIQIELDALGDKLSAAFGTKVKIQNGAKKGKIEIEYYNNEDLDRILKILNI